LTVKGSLEALTSLALSSYPSIFTNVFKGAL